MQKINIRRIIYRIRHKYLTLNNLVVVAALIVAAGWAWGALQMMERNYALQASLDDKQRELEVLQIDTETVRLQQRYYQTEEYLELAARDRLGLAFPGERVLILPPNTKEADETSVLSQETPAQQTPPGNFQQWMNFLFGGNARNLSE
jgi:cell division protein FtsB